MRALTGFIVLFLLIVSMGCSQSLTEEDVRHIAMEYAGEQGSQGRQKPSGETGLQGPKADPSPTTTPEPPIGHSLMNPQLVGEVMEGSNGANIQVLPSVLIERGVVTKREGPNADILDSSRVTDGILQPLEGEYWFDLQDMDGNGAIDSRDIRAIDSDGNSIIESIFLNMLHGVLRVPANTYKLEYWIKSRDVWEEVVGEDIYVDSPLDGNRFYMISIKVSYPSDDESLIVSTSDFELIGENNTIYNQYDESCGVIPNEIGGVVYRWDGIDGNICFQVPKDEEGFILIYQPDNDQESRRYLELP